MALSDFGRRLLGAARLEQTVYAEVASDRRANAQAWVVALFAAMAAAVGRVESVRAVPVVAATLIGLGGWAVWTVVANVVGARLVPHAGPSLDAGARVRVFGFAAAPALVQVVGAAAALRPWAIIVAEVGSILAVVIAIRRTFGAPPTSRVLAASLIGWSARVAVMLVLVAALRPLLSPRERQARRRPAAVPTAGYLGVVKPSGIAPPVE